MVIIVHTAFLQGLEGFHVAVEVSSGRGLPAFFIVGLADTAVQEARKRVESAIVHSGFTFPARKLTINLAPASIAKKGTLFDLPIAVGILATELQITAALEQTLLFGELSLDGRVRGVPGALGVVDFARRAGYQTVILPADNAPEVAWVQDIRICPVRTLEEAIRLLQGEFIPARDPLPPTSLEEPSSASPLMEHIRGHTLAKRALTIAAAGGHNVLMIGPPGTGKSLLAKAVATILPPLRFEEALEVTKIHSLARLLPEEQGLIQHRPFRTIHSTISPIALIGGGPHAYPGEITLAHRGVLFIDELGEFPKPLLETLRQPLEERCVTLSRMHHHVSYPASFQLIATSNPCPCGYLHHQRKPCTCTAQKKLQYQQKFSGPLLDRCDMILPIEKQPMHLESASDNSKQMQQQVREARARQLQRQAKLNAELGTQELEDICVLPKSLHALLHLALEKQDGSARAYHRVLKLARTIADLDHAADISKAHLLEALQYKGKSSTVQTNRLSG